ncbi:FitA-like ribbon-helix-helix domain-containing protein [Geodermatophilus sp. SYSU D00814]
MATIQVRDVPEDVHRTYRRRAAEAGMSLQEYLLGELVEGARAQTPAEVVAEVEQHLERSAGQGFAGSSSVDVVRADRDSR